jgi:hypothetical protein
MSVLVWDPATELCQQGVCSEITAEGMPVFRNWDHLSYAGALSLGSSFERFLEGSALLPRRATSAVQ